MKDGPQVQEDYRGYVAVCCGGFRSESWGGGKLYAITALVDHVKTVHGMDMLPENALVVKVDR